MAMNEGYQNPATVPEPRPINDPTALGVSAAFETASEGLVANWDFFADERRGTPSKGAFG